MGKDDKKVKLTKKGAMLIKLFHNLFDEISLIKKTTFE